MAALTAFLDANVLYSSELRNLLMYLALSGLYRPKWSAEVHEEWIGNLLKNRPDLSREKLTRTRQLMEKAAPDALVIGYEHLIADLYIPDANDRHVMAAALHGEAHVIVTRNLADFPTTVLRRFNLEVQHPDDFIFMLFEAAPEMVLGAARDHRNSLKNPPKTIDEYLASLEFQGLTQTVSAFRSSI